MLRTFASGSLLALAFSTSAAAQSARAEPSSSVEVDSVVVTASRRDLIGAAITASQGSVTRQEIELRPIYRIGQLYESVTGLVVTVHSGEGKANQYLMRGFNLDHGTDFASFVDGMPVNRPTNTHGQGYSDQNFLMPEIVEGLDYTKGPYYAAVGDFGAVGSAHVHLTDDLANQVSASVGTLDDEELFAGGTWHLDSDDRVWGVIDYGHLNGPWNPPSNFNKINLAGRYSHGTDVDGYSITGMYYQSAGRLETDQSVYAIADGLIGRYGTLDPSDGSRSERYSVSGHYGATGDQWRFSANLYAIHSTMTLYNDFTHYLFDQVNGDQEQQDETRDTFGGDVALALIHDFGSIDTETTFGVQERYDGVHLDRRHTRDRVVLDYCELVNVAGTAATPYAAVGGDCSADRVQLNDLGLYIRNTTHWTPWLRTVLGLREEDYAADDHSLTLGVTDQGSQTLFQPKGSLVLGPWLKTELYISAGRGFHSNDVRGVFETVPLEGIQNLGIKTPFMSPATGEEVGLRTDTIPRVQAQVAVFQEDFTSELAYDQDQGEDQASAPSRRQGVEVSAEYRPFQWIELNTDLAVAKARYVGSLAELATYGLSGPYIANAPSFIGSLGVLVDNLGPWYGGLQWRDLGPYPVAENGAQYPRDKGYSEVNVDIGRRVSRRLKVQVSIYNLFNTQADAAAYYYTSRLVPSGPEVTGPQIHPLEPISARVEATATF
jgi:outer membrane receptor protein involved in Fe transport